MDRAVTIRGLLKRLSALLIAMTLLAVSCGGSSDDAGDSASDTASDSAPDTDAAEPNDEAPSGPQRGGELNVIRGRQSSHHHRLDHKAKGRVGLELRLSRPVLEALDLLKRDSAAGSPFPARL